MCAPSPQPGYQESDLKRYNRNEMSASPVQARAGQTTLVFKLTQLGPILSSETKVSNIKLFFLSRELLPARWICKISLDPEEISILKKFLAICRCEKPVDESPGCGFLSINFNKNRPLTHS